MSELETRIAALPDKSLLLLDDDQALRTRMGRALEARGFQVTTAESVSEATQLLRDAALTTPIDLVPAQAPTIELPH